MWTLQSTSTHKGPRGHVFSPCLKWKGPIHHWLFVTETEATESICVVLRVCVCVCAFACINYSHSYMCVCLHVCVWFVHVRCTVKIRGQNNAFSASKYHDCNIYCLHSFDKSCSSASHCTEKSPQMFTQICSFSMSMWWMSSIDFVHEAKTIETKTNVRPV